MIVHRFEGDIQFDSLVGQHTEFMFTFKLEDDISPPLALPSQALHDLMFEPEEEESSSLEYERSKDDADLFGLRLSVLAA